MRNNFLCFEVTCSFHVTPYNHERAFLLQALDQRINI